MGDKATAKDTMKKAGVPVIPGSDGLLDTVEEAIELAKQNDYKELMVIGGGEIYSMAMPLAQTIYLTRVHTTIEGDTYFPELGKEWVKELPAKIRVGLGKDVDDPNCLEVTQNSWKATTQGGVLQYALDIKNNCQMR